jgi:hypothetical protein
VNVLRRFLQRLNRTDEELLAEEVREWSESVKGTVRITEARPRTRLKLAGIVRRITVRPVEGFESLEAVLWDGTGEVSAVWMGRRHITGLALGSRLVVQGIVGKERGALRIVNPTFEFA